ncbi:MAG: acyltransferase family protein [Rhizomicrobium sp.]
MPHAQIPEPGRLRYRADIDGLRAVAVVPVVLYHFGVRGFGGGFVGVDIFFVISGYLITGLIFAELRGQSFSVLRFYERRIRRIFPALFAVIVASLAAGTVVLFPRDLLRLAESAAATTVFGSNFDFWQQAGYFDVGAELKPLLHTWSLAVEEQFYVVFPALLYVLHSRRRATLLGLVVALGVFSFAASLWAVGRAPTAAFYLAPFRTWELMLGAVLALGQFPAPRSRLAGEAISLAGLAAIAWAVLTFTIATPFPGANALFPCAGAAALIYAGGAETLTRRLLSSPPLVGIGLISYSLYLWHWPIHVFADYASGRPAAAIETAALIALSFALGYLSWRHIERPFRGPAIPRRTIFLLAGLAIATTLVLCGALFALQGLPQRFTPDIRRIFAEADDSEPRRHDCFNRTAEDVAAGRICAIGDTRAASPSFVLWGDSHADAILPAVADAARRAGRKGLFVAHGRCPPLLLLSLTDEPTGRCAQLNAAALALIRRDRIGEVVLAARWPYYDQGTGFGPDASEVRHLIDLAPAAPHDADQHAAFARVLERTIRALGHVKIVLVATVPEPGFDVPQVLARDALHHLAADRRPTRDGYAVRNAFVLRDFADLRRRYAVTVVDPAAALCATGRCTLARDGRPLYVDHHHLSALGALTLAPLFDPAFR